MRTGKLSISRGSQLPEAAAREPRLTLVPKAEVAPAAPAAPAAPVEHPVQPLPSSDYRLMHDRLTALERLARLHSQDLLSAEEFAAEKAMILSLPADELVLRQALPEPSAPPALPEAERGPSLLGRMLSWRLVPIGLVAGLGLSFGAQPQETMRFFDHALSLIGA